AASSRARASRRSTASRSRRESPCVADEELTPEKLADQIRELKIEDILLSTVSTLGQLTYVKLDANELDQARLAIDAIAALIPALEGRADAQLVNDYKQLLANVRMSYANAVSASGSEQRPADTEEREDG